MMMAAAREAGNGPGAGLQERPQQHLLQQARL
jgi:hypothetical protein